MLKVLTSPSNLQSFRLANQTFRPADQINKQSLRLIDSISKDHQIITNFARKALNIIDYQFLQGLFWLISI